MRKCHTLFISDIHLGSKHCKAEKLLEFLKTVEFESLYIVGDFLDLQQMKRKFFCPIEHMTVIQKILKLARRGKKITYLCGNHEAELRFFVDNHFGGINFVNEAVHQGQNGKHYLVTHGDIFDPVYFKSFKFIYWLGDSAYSIALAVNTIFNWGRKMVGMDYWSLSAYLKSKVKGAVSFVNDMEGLMVTEAKRKGHAGVIYGHTHTPGIKVVDGIEIMNDGDWVESCTALAELTDGSWELWK